MKHWIVGGTLVIVGTIGLLRSRTSVQQAVPRPTTGVATTQGIAWPPTSRITRDPIPAATTTRGIAIQSLPNLRIAPATEPSGRAP